MINTMQGPGSAEHSDGSSRLVEGVITLHEAIDSGQTAT